MKSFLLRGILFSSLAYALFAVWLWIDSPVAGDSYFSVLEKKFARLETLRGRKIVLAGGSNVCYGIDSTEIERTFGLPVVNMGVHANLGMMYQLRSIVPFVRPGDIVLFFPEYEQFFGDRMLGGRELFYVLNNVKRDHWKYLSPRQIVRHLGFLVLEEPKKAESIWYYRQHPEDATLRLSKRYNARGFNDQGDEIWHWSDVRRYPISNRMSEAKCAVPAALDELLRAKGAVRARGAELHILPPGFYEGKFDSCRLDIMSLAEQMARQGVPFEIPPDAFRMDASEMGDTPYHLNLAGVERRTRRVIDWLRGILPEKRAAESVPAVQVRLPTMQDVGCHLECSPGFTNRTGSATAFIRTSESFGENAERIRVRIPGLRSRDYRLALCFRTSRRMYRAMACGNRLECFLDAEDFKGENEIALEVQLNETEMFVDSRGDTVFGISFPFWQLQPGDVVELTDIRFVRTVCLRQSVSFPVSFSVFFV